MRKKILLLATIGALCVLSIAGCGKKKQETSVDSASLSKIEISEEVNTETSTEINNEVTDPEDEKSKEVVEEEKNVTSDSASTEASVSDSEENQEDEKKEEVKEVKDTLTDAEYVLLYNKILKRTYNIIMDEDYWDHVGEGEIGIAEVIAENDNRLSDVIYCLEDVNKDGSKELFIINKKYNYILAAYTLVDNSPLLFIEGWARNAYYYLGDGMFGYIGSGGASSSAAGTFKASDDCKSLEVVDFYFSDFDNLYHNTNGEWTPSTSEKIDWDYDKLWAYADELKARTIALDFTTMAEYGAELKSEDANSQVIIAWARDVLTDASVFDDVIIDKNDYTSKIVFSCKSEVMDFKILQLELKDFDENEEISFDVVEVYAKHLLNRDKLVVATVSFAGDIPNYGFSYIDDNGDERKFAIYESGKDGTLDLYEFK